MSLPQSAPATTPTTLSRPSQLQALLSNYQFKDGGTSLKRKSSYRKESGGGGYHRSTDRFPQTLEAIVTTGASANWTSTSVEVPLLNLGNAGLPNALEILRVEFDQTNTAAIDMFVAVGSYNANSLTTTQYPYSTMLTDKRYVAKFRTGNTGHAELNLTDNNGFGILYPGQELYINVSSLTAAVSTQVIRVFYRIHKSTLEEYLGIVNQYIVTQL